MITLENNFSGLEGTQLHSVIWEPEDKPAVAVLHIIHGMTEHIGRYKELAETLTNHGIVVCGFSLRGHGKSETSSRLKGVATLGKNGWYQSLAELKMFSDEMHIKYEGLPYYMYGFSLGSFLLRDYLGKYKDNLSGAIIAGTGNQSKLALSLVKTLVKNEVKNSGFDNPTTLVDSLSFDTYNGKFKNTKTKYDWLCSNDEAIRQYRDDDLCKKRISSGLFLDLLESMSNNSSLKACRKWNTEIPVLVMYGVEDPVGNFGKGIEKFVEQLEYASIDFSIIGFDSSRHDFLHEKDAEAAMIAIRDFVLDTPKSNDEEGPEASETD